MIKRKSQFRSIRVEWPIPPTTVKQFEESERPDQKIQGTQIGLEAVEGQQVIGRRLGP